MTERLFSGIQPSGNLHLGNYLGAIKQWLPLQDEYEAIFCVVDMHAITVPQDPVELRKKTIEIAKIYLASGIDPKKSTLFVQSHVPGHAELGWILNTITKIGELKRMTQYKDKSGNIYLSAYQKNIEQIERHLVEASAKDTFSKDEYLGLVRDFREGVEKPLLQAIDEGEVGVGLFDYPVLMAADILLYDTATVPVGEDQKQHVELTRDLAQRFNSRFGETFVVPEPLIQREGARIMGLDDPTKKMSKSAASEYNYIALSDDADTIRKKIKKAVTDSGSEIVYADDKPALMNLINIYTLLSGKKVDEVEAMYVGRGYGDFKTDLAEVVVNFLVPFQERLAAISDYEVLAVLRAGAEKARAIAEKKVAAVYEKVGFVR
ncbi:MAG: tryptophan--tRNA ligase [Candidatus Moraniibacteriota bacterium]